MQVQSANVDQEVWERVARLFKEKHVPAAVVDCMAEAQVVEPEEVRHTFPV